MSMLPGEVKVGLGMLMLLLMSLLALRLSPLPHMPLLKLIAGSLKGPRA